MPVTSLLVDSHMHTPLCGHAYGAPSDYARQAVERGLDAICFTCHGPMPKGWWPEIRMRDEELDVYAGWVAETTAEFASDLNVRLGLESDYFPGMESWSESLHQRHPFHYILGSVHYQGQAYQALFDPTNSFEFQKSYFRLLADCAETGLFDCLSHPDLVKNHRPKDWIWERIEPFVAAALDRIAKTGVAMELNTSGLNKALPEMNPGPKMLKLMSERGIPVVLGSDSHVPHRVADRFEQALWHLEDAGYQKVSYYVNRKRHELDIATLTGAKPIVESLA